MKLDDETRLISEEAFEWLELLESPAASAQIRAHFVKWLKISPAHVREVFIAMAVNMLLDERSKSLVTSPR